MKRIFGNLVIVFALFLLIANSNTLLAQCDECIDKEIYFFDASVPAPPDSTGPEFLSGKLYTFLICLLT